jgi:MinD-like ATPase involved in chromosome partitioning or flagellar assembly
MVSIAGSPLVAFVGARGGVGTSTLVATCATMASQHHERVALLDGSPRNGLELLLGRDDHQGPYWQDFLSMPVRTVERAPARDEELSLIAWRNRTPPDWNTVLSVVDGYQRSHSLLFADCGVLESSTEEALLQNASAIILVLPGELRPLTNAAHLTPTLTAIAPTQLVICEPSPTGISHDHLADLLNLPIAAVLARESRLALRGEHAQLPTRPLRATAKNILRALGL